MKRYFLKRVISGVINFLFILMLNFLLMATLKGDVTNSFNPPIPLEVKRRMRQALGLNKSTSEQFIIWLKNLLKGDMGKAYKAADMEIKYELSQMYIKTIEVLIPAIIIATIICVIFGAILHAKKRSSFTELAIKVFCYIGISVPSFLIVTFLVKFFTGEHTIKDFIDKDNGNVFITGEHLEFFDFKMWLIPFVAVTILAIAQIFKYLDSLLKEVMSSDFIRTARSKGLTEKRIMYKHALKNCACPLITVIGLSFTGLMSNQLVIEIVLKRNGLGMGLYRSVLNRDYPVIMGIILYITVIVLVLNIVVDFIYTIIDPRIKMEG